MPWEMLKPFFRSKGYILFKAGGPDGELSMPQPVESGYKSPTAEYFGLYGDRVGFKSTFGRVSYFCNKSCSVCLIVFGRNLWCLQLETGLAYFVLPPVSE